MKIPDTKLAREAEGTVKLLLSSSFYNHSVRSFLLGKSYGLKRGVKFDEEDLYLVSLFHDIGVYINGSNSFMAKGAEQLKQFLTTHQQHKDRAHRLAEAVEFHMSLLPRWSSSSCAGLLQVGAWMDITGLRFWTLPRQLRSEIYNGYPKLNIKKEFQRNLMKVGFLKTTKYVLCCCQ